MTATATATVSVAGCAASGAGGRGDAGVQGLPEGSRVVAMAEGEAAANPLRFESSAAGTVYYVTEAGPLAAITVVPGDTVTLNAWAPPTVADTVLARNGEVVYRQTRRRPRSNRLFFARHDVGSGLQGDTSIDRSIRDLHQHRRLLRPIY